MRLCVWLALGAVAASASEEAECVARAKVMLVELCSACPYAPRRVPSSLTPTHPAPLPSTEHAQFQGVASSRSEPRSRSSEPPCLSNELRCL